MLIDLRKMLILSLVLSAGSARADERTILWQIGTSNNDTAEFADGPSDYAAYRSPPLFVVGHSDPRVDWPYVLPGTIDEGWAPGTPQTFEVQFELKAAPSGICQLVLDFTDTHSVAPPMLRVTVNDRFWDYQTPKGAGDASVFGEPAKGREHVITVSVPADALQPGDNRVSVTSLSDSWVLWDALRFEAPPGTALVPVNEKTAIHSVRAPCALARHEGHDAQVISLNVTHIGKSQAVDVRIGDRATTLDLKSGNHTVDVYVPPVAEPQQAAIEISRQGDVLAATEVDLKPVRRWEIHLVHQTHLDIGYTHTQEEVLNLQVEHLRTALKYIEKTKDYPPGSRFIWHPEGMWAVEEFLRIASEEEKKIFIKACQDKQIHIDALYAQAMTGMYSEEELMELVSAAKRFEKQYGVEVVSAMQSDVPGYTWGLASVLPHNGVKFLSASPNWAADGGANDYFKGPNISGRTHRGGRVFAWADQPFWWVNPSGKHKILFWMPGWGYSGFHGNRGEISEEKVFAYLDHLQSKNYPYDMVYWRYGIGTDNGPPSPDLCDVVKAWNEKFASPRLIVTSNSAVMKQFAERYGDEIPIVKGDYTPYWEDGTASTSKATAVNRRACERLAQVQALWSSLNPSLALHEHIDAAWNKMIMYDEHTWGAYNSISKPDDAFAVHQDKYKQAYAFDGSSLTDALLQQVTRSPKKSATLDVHNTTSWDRDGLVRISQEQSKTGDRVVDDEGRAVPSQRLASGELAFVAKAIPAMGARRYTVRSGEALSTGAAQGIGSTLKNGLLQLSVDSLSGAISSLRRRELDVDLVDTSKSAGLNDFLYIIGRDADKNRSTVQGPVAITVEDAGPLVATLRVESDAPGCERLTRRIRLIDGFDHVELLNSTDKLKERRPEGLYFGFPFNVPESVVRVDVPWATVEMDKEQMRGANRNFCCVQRWVDMSNQNHGVTWVTVDAPMVQFDPIKLAPAFGVEHWREHFRPRSHLWSWAMNNHWETNYKADQEGVIEFAYAIRPHAGGYDSVAAQQFGRSICQPLIAVFVDSSKAPIDPLFALEGGDGVVVTSVRPSRHGKAWIVRLFNTADESSQVRLRWQRPVRQTWISNPMEEKTQQAPAQLSLVRHEIVTLRVEQ
jgi:hypothetical protein